MMATPEPDRSHRAFSVAATRGYHLFANARRVPARVRSRGKSGTAENPQHGIQSRKTRSA